MFKYLVLRIWANMILCDFVKVVYSLLMKSTITYCNTFFSSWQIARYEFFSSCIGEPQITLVFSVDKVQITTKFFSRLKARVYLISWVSWSYACPRYLRLSVIAIIFFKFYYKFNAKKRERERVNKWTKLKS